MPTNILRRRGLAASASAAGSPSIDSIAGRRVQITAGSAVVRAELLATPTAARVWAALPLYSTAETWGGAIHFEVTIETGRERGARVLVAPGDIAFWCEEGRVIIAFGPTPISRSSEIRLAAPANVWAKSLDDVTLLNRVVPGEKVSVTAV